MYIYIIYGIYASDLFFLSGESFLSSLFLSLSFNVSPFLVPSPSISLYFSIFPFCFSTSPTTQFTVHFSPVSSVLAGFSRWLVYDLRLHFIGHRLYSQLMCDQQ